MLRLTTTPADVYVDLLERVAMMVDFRDDGSGGHARRVGDLAGDLARQLGLSHERAELIRKAAPLHDIGKIAIPPETLHKPGPLMPRERVIMQRHTTVGSMILGDSTEPVIQLAESIARHHHEKWNGSGYPDDPQLLDVFFGPAMELALSA